jgi:hypothetical protein
MKKLILIIVILCIGYWYYTKPKQAISATGGHQITVKSNGFKAELSIGAPLAEGYVLFGAGEGSAFGDATLSGLPQHTAKSLYRSYPDLDRCNSAGNAELRRGMERVNVVVADRSIKSKLADIMGDVRRREGTASSRVCIKMSGKALDILELKHMGESFTYDDSVLKGHALIEALDVVECSVLLN